MRKPRKMPILRHLSLLFALGLYALKLFAQMPTATESTAAPTDPIPPEKAYSSSRVERDNALLALALPEEIQWLETPNEKIIALFKPSEAEKSMGVIVILHTPETPQLWPAPLENLRRHLPIYGWDTMAVPLPSMRPAETLTLDTTPTSTALNTEQIALEPLEARTTTLTRIQSITERISAAITRLGELSQPNLTAVIDNSSVPDSIDALNKASLKALILVNLQPQEPLTKMQLAALFANRDLPILDVFFYPDDKYQIELRRLHKAEAMRKKVTRYQQLILPPQNFVAIDDKQ